MPKRGLIVKVIISALILSFGHTLPAQAVQPSCYIVTGGIITNIGSCTGAVVVGPEVTAIGDGVFDPFFGWDYISPQKFITSIDFSNSGVVSIGDHAFSNNAQLETVTLSATLRTIGPSAFAGNQNLRSINFLEGLTSIGPCAFCMAQISQIVIPDSVTDIAIDAFIGNEALASVNIGAGLVNLGMNAIPTSFQGTVIVSTGNGHFKAEGGKLFTMAGEQLTGFPQPSEMPMSDSGPKNDDGNSVPILEKGFSNRQGQSQNGGNNVVNGDQQSDNSAQAAAEEAAQAAAVTEAARVAAAQAAAQAIAAEAARVAAAQAAAQAIAAEAARVAAAQAAAAEAARIAAEIKAAEVAKAKSDLKNILQNDGKPSFDTFKAAGIEGITQKNVEKVSEKILTLPVEQRSNPIAIEKMITVVTFFDPETPPTIADFANKGIGTVTNKIISKVAIELLTVPESQQGDVAVIKQIVQRVATVDKLSTPETSKSVQASDLVAINALSNSNTKKVTITSALKKLDPSSIDTFQEVLAEISKQEAIIKARAEKSAAIKAKLAARSAKP
jgi:hypothetical protein